MAIDWEFLQNNLHRLYVNPDVFDDEESSDEDEKAFKASSAAWCRMAGRHMQARMRLPPPATRTTSPP